MFSLLDTVAIAFMIYAFGHISGAHINPAVTIPMMITKKDWNCRWNWIYHISQLIGASCNWYSKSFLARNW